jgi:hypothetical protein
MTKPETLPGNGLKYLLLVLYMTQGRRKMRGLGWEK